jgi:Protein of unknown function (DUF4236)
MGLYLKRRVGVGPFALNISKSGLGISTGFRGFRAGLSAHRGLYTSANVPGTGIYFRRYYRHHHSSEPSPFATAFAIGAALPFVILLAIVWAAATR